jgi:hypothetical protein
VTGLGLALAGALASRLTPLVGSGALAGLALVLALAGALVTAALTWVWPRTPQRVVRALDLRLGLAERLTTALEVELGRAGTTPAMAAAQRDDTVATISTVDASAGLPLRVPGHSVLAAVILSVILVALLLLPNPQEAILQQRAAVEAAIEEQLEELEAARDGLLAESDLAEQDRAALLEALEEAMAALESEEVDLEQAVAALAETERALASLQDPTADMIQDGLERATEELADSELTEQIAELLEQGDYAAAAAALAALAGREGELLPQEEESELAQQLAEAAAALAESAPDLAQQLAEAAAAIDQDEIAQAREELLEAAQQLTTAGEKMSAQQALEELLASLQEGRAEIAAAGENPTSGRQGEGVLGQGQSSQGEPGDQLPAAGQQTEPGHSEDAGSAAAYDKVYVPDRISGDGPAIDLGREGDEGPQVGEVPLPAPAAGESNVPYVDVYADYSARAHAALDGSYIPLGMKQYIRDYFSSLQP